MTRDQIIQWAREAGMDDWNISALVDKGRLQAFAALVAEHEREECAKVCEGFADEAIADRSQASKSEYKPLLLHTASAAAWCADTIRQRGNK